jgi:hypothetical protein
VVNVEYGSIAHGHTLGATGAGLTMRLLHCTKGDGRRSGDCTRARKYPKGIGRRLSSPGGAEADTIYSSHGSKASLAKTARNAFLRSDALRTP